MVLIIDLAEKRREQRQRWMDRAETVAREVMTIMPDGERKRLLDRLERELSAKPNES